MNKTYMFQYAYDSFLIYIKENTDLITLEEEISLSSSYFFLQQKRFGKGLSMNLNVEENKKKLLI